MPGLATPTITGLPRLWRAPVDRTVYEGQTSKFRVAARGRGLRYQWQVNSGSGWSDVGGATSANYTTDATVRSTDSGKQYRCIVSNSAGRVIAGPATLTVWSPLDLGSDLAVWLDPSQGIYQERTGASATTATTDGNVVGTWRARNDTINGICDNDTYRPIYRATGINGQPAIEFDGSDDRINFTTDLADTTRNKSYVYVFAGVALEVSSSIEMSVFAAGTGTSVTRLNLTANVSGGSGRILAGGRQLDANSYASASVASGFLGLEPMVIAGEWLYASSDCYLRKNSVRHGTNTSFQADGATSDTASTGVHIGASVAGTNNWIDGMVSHIVVVTPSAALTTTQMEQIEGFIQSKMGTQHVYDWNLTSRTTGLTAATADTPVRVITPNGSAVTEGDIATHRYHHHNMITVHKGRIHLAFTSGSVAEDCGGQQVVYTYSDDVGATWATPQVVLPSQSNWDTTAFAVDSHVGLTRKWVNLDGDLYCVCACDRYYGSGFTDGLGIMLAARKVNDNGTLGSLFRVSPSDYTTLDSKTKVDYDSVLGPLLFDEANIFGDFGGSTPNRTASDYTGWVDQNSVYYAELVARQIGEDEDILHRIGRDFTNLTAYAHMDRSTDGGSTWGHMTRTNVPSGPSFWTHLKLYDGRIALLGNTVSARTELVLATFDPDTLRIELARSIVTGISDTPVYPGTFKSGGAAYPSAVQRGNYLYVSWSERKEDIWFARVLIPGLADNDNDG